MTRAIWWNLTWAVESPRIYTLMGYLCRKYVMFELKNYRGVECFSWMNVFFSIKSYHISTFWTFHCFLFKFVMWLLKPGVSFCINFAPFCNTLPKTKVSSVNGIFFKPQYKVYRESSIFYFNAPFFWCSLSKISKTQYKMYRESSIFYFNAPFFWFSLSKISEPIGQNQEIWKHCLLSPLSFKISLRVTSFHISLNSLGFYLFRKLAEFFLTCIFQHMWEKCFNLCCLHS